MSIPIAYCDAWYVAVNKPSGLLVHRPPGSATAAASTCSSSRDSRYRSKNDGCANTDNASSSDKACSSDEYLIDILQAQLGNEKLYLVHRLDKGTSGLLILARSREACAALQSIWGSDDDGNDVETVCDSSMNDGRNEKRRKVVKEYLCCVDGVIDEYVHCQRPLKKKETLADRLKRKRQETCRRKQQAIDKTGDTNEKGTKGHEETNGRVEAGKAPENHTSSTEESVELGGDSLKQPIYQSCSTIFTRLGTLWHYQNQPRVSLVRCTLQTGRTHQIRRHLAGLNHAIFGDNDYGKTKINAWLKSEYGLERIFLHSAQLKFDHPFIEKRVVLTSPLPRELVDFLQRLPESDLGQFAEDVIATF